MWFLSLPALVIGLLLLALFLTYRSIYRHSENADSTLPFVVAALLVALAVEGTWQHTQLRASQVIQEVSGKPQGYAVCLRISDEFISKNPIPGAHGWVSYDQPDTAFVRYEPCRAFREFLWFGGEKMSDVEALGLIIHEGFHVDGDFSESSTECKTINAYAEIAEEMFDINSYQAERMARQYAANNAYRPDAYRCTSHIYADRT